MTSAQDFARGPTRDPDLELRRRLAALEEAAAPIVRYADACDRIGTKDDATVLYPRTDMRITAGHFRALRKALGSAGVSALAMMAPAQAHAAAEAAHAARRLVAAAAVYQRPYGPDAAWNRPASDFGRHPDSARFVAKLFRADGLGLENPRANIRSYTYTVYRAAAGTITPLVSAAHPSWGNLSGRRLPWAPGWRGSPGSDGQAIVLDPATGREWDLWRVGALSGGVLAVGSGSLVPGSYWTKVDGFPPVRGSGLPCLAGLVMPEEVEGGAILHALSWTIRNVDKGGAYLPPAEKSDGAQVGSDAELDGVPEGLRFAVAMSDADFAAWLATRPARLRRIAGVLGQAMRGYGGLVTDHGGIGAFQMQDWLTAGPRWSVLGLTTAESDRGLILSGLMTRENTYVVRPPAASVAR